MSNFEYMCICIAKLDFKFKHTLGNKCGHNKTIRWAKNEATDIYIYLNSHNELIVALQNQPLLLAE